MTSYLEDIWLTTNSRTEFTERDDDLLAQYIAKYNPQKEGRTGNALYKQLEANVRPSSSIRLSLLLSSMLRGRLRESGPSPSVIRGSPGASDTGPMKLVSTA